MAVNNRNNLFQIKRDNSQRVEVDQIVVQNHSDSKARDPNSDTDLEGEITTTQNQDLVSKIRPDDEFFTIYIQEDASTISDDWVIDNVKITGSPSQETWEWVAQGLHG